MPSANRERRKYPIQTERKTFDSVLLCRAYLVPGEFQFRLPKVELDHRDFDIHNGLQRGSAVCGFRLVV
jgi:hypothetical protein